MSGGASKGAAKGLVLAALALDVFAAAVRGTYEMRTPENRGRAKLLPHLPFALNACACAATRVEERAERAFTRA